MSKMSVGTAFRPSPVMEKLNGESSGSFVVMRTVVLRTPIAEGLKVHNKRCAAPSSHGGDWRCGHDEVRSMDAGGSKRT